MARARLLAFPIRCRNWCFSRSVDPSACKEQSANTPATLVELWNRLSKPAVVKPSGSKIELVVDFATTKMSNQWSNLEKAPAGSFKSKLHGLGLKLLSTVKPSEIFLKSISKEVDKVEITYPSSLNGRLVRRRVRHIAFRGTVIHKRYLYGSTVLLPLTTVFMVLPLPNIPFFWILFRTYSHWRALKGSEKLLELVTEHPDQQHSNKNTTIEMRCKKANSNENSPWVLNPSEELQKLLNLEHTSDGTSESTLSAICQRYHLNMMDVAKYRNSL
ncbi:unnamed protein product [Cuscuta campestris]|uniref:Uncharacterized protein n=2 Tax=Cuscuta sect. Cleistogrammica TaxID=1824901 RepID=A0A484NII5_9ASTE|nr:hypothetical protein DM860_014323 [Cuscuta australis]VFR00119.1 unnamed protein product [Cuscuta campestris]